MKQIMTLQQFLTAFVKQETIYGFNFGCGVCNNIEYFCGVTSKYEFQKCFSSWPKSSGCKTFPILDLSIVENKDDSEKYMNHSIRHYHELMADLQYFESDLYVDNQLELRIDLCKHALKEIYGVVL